MSEMAGPGATAQIGPAQALKAGRTILEHAILPVRSGSETKFEAAFAHTRRLISGQPLLDRKVPSPLVQGAKPTAMKALMPVAR